MTNYIKTIRQKIGHDMLLVVGAGALPYRNGRVLLQLRRDNGCWAINGGSMEIGETSEQVARRELFEETGLTAGKLEFLGVYSGEDMLYTYPNGDRVCVVAIIFTCTDFSGELSAQESEVSELRWFDINDIPASINPPDLRPVSDFIETMNNRRQNA